MMAEGKLIFNAKLLEEKLKKGWGTIQFSEYLGVSVEEFKQLLDKTFDGTVEENYRRRLKKNDKKIEQQLRRRATSVKADPFEEKAEEISTDVARKQNNADDTARFSEAVNNEENDMEILEKLQREEEMFRKNLISLENDHKASVAERKEFFEALATFRSKMIKLKKEIEECQLKVQEYTIKKDQISTKIEKINQDKLETKKQISEIQEQIKKLQKIEVFVYKGSIEIVPAEYEIPEGWKELRNNWIDDERFESLTLMELSILAKAVLLAKAISADDRKSVFVFESDQMQQLFSEISK